MGDLVNNFISLNDASIGAERMLGYRAAEVMNKITPADISDRLWQVTRA